MKEFDVLTLDNGIHCVHRHTDRPVAQLSLTIGAGTRDELPNQHGVAHLVEHLLFKGTSGRTAYRINSCLDSVGGELNAFTSKEETAIYATCLTDYVAQGADLLADMAFNSTFASTDVDKEREVIIDEINSYKDSPAELIFDQFEELLFAQSSLGRNILGSKRLIKRVGREDLIRFCADNYNTNEMVFAMSSSLSTKKFENLCVKVFSRVKPQSRKVGGRVAPKAVERFDVERNIRAHQTHVILGGYAPSVFDERRVATTLLLNILGGPSALSRMNLLLREKYALTYNAEASFSPFTDSGLFTLYFSSESHKWQKAEKILRDELARLMDNELSDSVLSKYKKQMIGQMLICNDNNESSMMAVAKSLLLYNECESTENILIRIQSITANDIRQAAQLLFAPENLSRLSYQ